MEFHTALYEATGNQVLVRIMEPLLDHVQRVVTFVQSPTGAKGRDRLRKLRRAPGNWACARRRRPGTSTPKLSRRSPTVAWDVLAPSPDRT
jgi:hypothetical protein